MTKQELIEKLKELAKSSDTEEAHGGADQLLIDFINDEEITEAYDSIKKWYA